MGNDAQERRSQQVGQVEGKQSEEAERARDMAKNTHRDKRLALINALVRHRFKSTLFVNLQKLISGNNRQLNNRNCIELTAVRLFSLASVCKSPVIHCCARSTALSDCSNSCSTRSNYCRQAEMEARDHFLRLSHILIEQPTRSCIYSRSPTDASFSTIWVTM